MPKASEIKRGQDGLTALRRQQLRDFRREREVIELVRSHAEWQENV